jgi:hypothetical protein
MEETTKRNSEDSKWPPIRISEWDLQECSLVHVSVNRELLRIHQRSFFKRHWFNLRWNIRDAFWRLRGVCNLFRWRFGEAWIDLVLKLRGAWIKLRWKLRETRKLFLKYF